MPAQTLRRKPTGGVPKEVADKDTAVQEQSIRRGDEKPGLLCRLNVQKLSVIIISHIRLSATKLVIVADFKALRHFSDRFTARWQLV